MTIICNIINFTVTINKRCHNLNSDHMRDLDINVLAK